MFQGRFTTSKSGLSVSDMWHTNLHRQHILWTSLDCGPIHWTYTAKSGITNEYDDAHWMAPAPWKAFANRPIMTLECLCLLLLLKWLTVKLAWSFHSFHSDHRNRSCETPSLGSCKWQRQVVMLLLAGPSTSLCKEGPLTNLNAGHIIQKLCLNWSIRHNGGESSTET